jgi:hypothetical protein
MLPHLWEGIVDLKVLHGLLQLLEKFDLAYSVEENSCQASNPAGACPSKMVYGVHRVPGRWSVTPQESLAELWPLSGAAIMARRLSFERLLPDGVFEQLLVRCLGLKNLALTGGRKVLWRSGEAWGSGACFECQRGLGNGCNLLVLMSRDDKRPSGELPGHIYFLGWKKHGRQAEKLAPSYQPGTGSPKMDEALGRVLEAVTAVVTLLNERFPGLCFEEEVICPAFVWKGLAELEEGGQSKVTFERIVRSVNEAEAEWRTLQELEGEVACACGDVHAAEFFGEILFFAFRWGGLHV